MENDLIGQIRAIVPTYADTEVIAVQITRPGQAQISLPVLYRYRKEGLVQCIGSLPQLRELIARFLVPSRMTTHIAQVHTLVRKYENEVIVVSEVCGNQSLRKIVHTYRLGRQDYRRVLNWDPVEFATVLESQLAKITLLESALEGAA